MASTSRSSRRGHLADRRQRRRQIDAGEDAVRGVQPDDGRSSSAVRRSGSIRPSTPGHGHRDGLPGPGARARPRSGGERVRRTGAVQARLARQVRHHRQGRDEAQGARGAFISLGTDVKDMDAPVAALSGGQRQCVAICRSVMWAKGLVFMDEPTAALGVRQTRTVLEVIRRGRRPGRGRRAHHAQHARGAAGVGPCTGIAAGQTGGGVPCGEEMWNAGRSHDRRRWMPEVTGYDRRHPGRRCPPNPAPGRSGNDRVSQAPPPAAVQLAGAHVRRAGRPHPVLHDRPSVDFPSLRQRPEHSDGHRHPDGDGRRRHLRDDRRRVRPFDRLGAGLRPGLLGEGDEAHRRSGPVHHPPRPVVAIVRRFVLGFVQRFRHHQAPGACVDHDAGIARGGVRVRLPAHRWHDVRDVPKPSTR